MGTSGLRCPGRPRGGRATAAEAGGDQEPASFPGGGGRPKPRAPGLRVKGMGGLARATSGVWSPLGQVALL